MNVVIMQPFFLFLRKHFHQIQRADLYIFMDNAQFVKNAHHNRNRIKGSNGYIWLTVPVKHNFGQMINQVTIDNNQKWKKKQLSSITQSYSKAPYFKSYIGFFKDVYTRDWNKLCDLNIHLIKHISEFLGIKNTEFATLSDLSIKTSQNPTQRLIDICEYVGASNYIIGTRAKDYMEEWRWEKTIVNLEYFEPDYPAYPQLYGEFIDNCAIIDLLFNCGYESGKYIWKKI